MSENRGGFLIGILAILLVIVLMIPITSILIDPDTPDPLNTPIYELNDHSLIELFEETTTLFDSEQLVTNGDFSDGTTGWTKFDDNTYYVSDGELIVEKGTDTLTSAIQPFASIVDHKYYYRLYFNYDVDGTYLFQINQQGDYQTLPNKEAYNSGIILSNYEGINLYIGQGPDATFIVIDDVRLYDITLPISNKQYSPLYTTTFDLMTDEQIKLQMDWFVANPHLFLPYQSLGIDNLTVGQIQYYYALYEYYSGL